MLTIFIISVGCALLISATCSVFEAVLLSLSASQVEMMGETHAHQAQSMKKLKQDIEQPITAILTLNTVAHTIGASVAGAAAAALFGQEGLIWFSLLFTVAILIFTEILPKTIGVAFARQLAPYIVRPLLWMIFLLRPFIWLTHAIINLIPNNNRSNRVTAEELKIIASMSMKSGDIEKEQEAVITNILQLGKKTVRQVMTPRTVTFSVSQSLTIGEAATLDEKWRMHSRVPIYEKEPDNVVGIVLSQDVLLAAAMEQNDMELTQIMRPAHFVPETAHLDRIFIDFFERYQHLFIVVDEYGSVTGVISMEDIIEEIIGREIVDESDKAHNMRELARIRKEKLSPAASP